jgi:hypothetical protein
MVGYISNANELREKFGLPSGNSEIAKMIDLGLSALGAAAKITNVTPFHGFFVIQDDIDLDFIITGPSVHGSEPMTWEAECLHVTIET